MNYGKVNDSHHKLSSYRKSFRLIYFFKLNFFLLRILSKNKISTSSTITQRYF